MNPSNRYDFPRELVARLYAEHRTTRGLAAELGISKSAAHSLLVRLGIPRRAKVRDRKPPRPPHRFETRS